MIIHKPKQSQPKGVFFTCKGVVSCGRTLPAHCFFVKRLRCKDCISQSTMGTMLCRGIRSCKKYRPVKEFQVIPGTEPPQRYPLCNKCAAKADQRVERDAVSTWRPSAEQTERIKGFHIHVGRPVVHLPSDLQRIHLAVAIKDVSMMTFV